MHLICFYIIFGSGHSVEKWLKKVSFYIFTKLRAKLIFGMKIEMRLFLVIFKLCDRGSSVDTDTSRIWSSFRWEKSCRCSAGCIEWWAAEWSFFKWIEFLGCSGQFNVSFQNFFKAWDDGFFFHAMKCYREIKEPSSIICRHFLFMTCDVTVS